MIWSLVTTLVHRWLHDDQFLRIRGSADMSVELLSPARDSLSKLCGMPPPQDLHDLTD